MKTPRRAKLADVGSLVQLMVEFHAEFGFELNTATATNAFKKLLGEDVLGAVWVAGDQSTPDAYVVLTFRFSMDYGALEAFIDDLYVRPQCRRLGFGKALLKVVFAVCLCRQARTFKVEVGRDNIAAHSLYRGFQMQESDRLTLTAQLGHIPMSDKNAAQERGE